MAKKITLESIDQSISDLAAMAAKEFQTVYKRFDEVYKRFDQHDKRFDQNDASHRNINARLDIIETDLSNLRELHRVEKHLGLAQ